MKVGRFEVAERNIDQVYNLFLLNIFYFLRVHGERNTKFNDITKSNHFISVQYFECLPDGLAFDDTGREKIGR